MGVDRGVLASRECRKQLLTTSNLLTYYDPSLPLMLTADASQYGLGAIISHILPSGEERLIAFASRSLSPLFDVLDLTPRDNYVQNWY